MTISIVVPPLGESITEATIARWVHPVGTYVQADHLVCELETDKVTLEINAPQSGVLTNIAFPQGSKVTIGTVIGEIDETATAGTTPAKAPEESAPKNPDPIISNDVPAMSPAVKKAVAETGIDPSTIKGSGKDGRLTKGDILETSAPAAPTPPPSTPAPSTPQKTAPVVVQRTDPQGRQTRVLMTQLRKRIAERLKEAQNTAAILTTFNEIDMSNVMAIRNRMKDEFEKKHGVKLGFMSFFVKACVQALKDIPQINARIDGQEIVYNNFYDIGVAVGAPQGLVVPVIRDADNMDFATMEKTIAEFGQKAREGRLSMQELSGGTFTISNGGIYGSLMSTPILNPPQSGILGMHKVQPRPVAVGEKLDRMEIRPMMYVALSYDHRIVDGKEAVTFLVRIKECMEDPERMLLGV